MTIHSERDKALVDDLVQEMRSQIATDWTERNAYFERETRLVDNRVQDMRNRIWAERADVIGPFEAYREANEVTNDWWRKEYARIRSEVEARFAGPTR